ncbi:hypothetical protein IF2G_06370 [Cordyceps javanica]|nr:hypothetical protein IF2G_06370 [Cordyceps javanica]
MRSMIEGAVHLSAHAPGIGKSPSCCTSEQKASIVNNMYPSSAQSQLHTFRNNTRLLIRSQAALPSLLCAIVPARQTTP